LICTRSLHLHTPSDPLAARRSRGILTSKILGLKVKDISATSSESFVFPAQPNLVQGASMAERHGAVTMKGAPLTLVGNEVKEGEAAPDFEALSNDLQPVTLSSYRGKVIVLSSVPSLDTPVCDMETRRFNQEAANLGDDVAILTISMDLPFAQKRWCGAAGVTRVTTLSDHRDAAFGMAYGVLIKELRLLARAVFVVDREGVVRHVQLVKEVASEPDYESVLKAVKACL
jgi:thiol peroxidase